MGYRGTRDRALGRLAVIGLRLAAVLALLGMAGCDTVSEIAGLATGAAAGGATANPAVGYAVAVGTAAGYDELFKWYARTRANGEQQAIADAQADLPDGGSAPWRIVHTLPYGNEHGDVRVVRTYTTPLATCREIVFSVLDDPPAPPALFDTSLCRDIGPHGERWQWALAEPAVPRWGALQ